MNKILVGLALVGVFIASYVTYQKIRKSNSNTQTKKK